MTKAEFETWVAKLPVDQQTQAKSFFTVIKRKASKELEIVPFSKEYGAKLKKASDLLKSAAKDTKNPSLKKFLELRAQAFLSDNYYDSDFAWMDLDSPIGPERNSSQQMFR